jgi:hypothetical protein
MIKKIIILLFVSFNLLAHHPGNQVEAVSPYPEISLDIQEDNIDGFNIYFTVNNFKITPENIGKENIDNEGYLHIYVNDIKIGRVYSNWSHVPGRFFNLKKNIIKVTLNTNMNDDYVIDGKPIVVEIEIKN